MEPESDEAVWQAKNLGMDVDRVLAEARAMGLDARAVLLAYARDYVDLIVDGQVSDMKVRVD